MPVEPDAPALGEQGDLGRGIRPGAVQEPDEQGAAPVDVGQALGHLPPAGPGPAAAQRGHDERDPPRVAVAAELVQHHGAEDDEGRADGVLEDPVEPGGQLDGEHQHEQAEGEQHQRVPQAVPERQPEPTPRVAVR